MRTDIMPVKMQQSLLTSEIAKQVVSSERKLNFPAVTSVLTIQNETVKHNGYVTFSMVEKLQGIPGLYKMHLQRSQYLQRWVLQRYSWQQASSVEN